MRHSSFVLLFLGCILVAFPIGCSPGTSDPSWTTPEEILGIWVTDNPNYAGRTMEVFEEALLFYTGESGFDTYIIRNIKSLEETDGTQYEIEHSGWEGGTLTLSFFFLSADSTIVFENQPQIVWRKGPPRR